MLMPCLDIIHVSFFRSPLIEFRFNILCRPKSEKSDDDASFSSSSHEHQIPMNSIPQNEFRVETNLSGKPELEANGKLFENLTTYYHQRYFCF